MAKTVFRPGEAKNIEEKVMLPLFKDYSPIEDVEVEEEEEYTGPTAEDLRREAEFSLNRKNFSLKLMPRKKLSALLRPQKIQPSQKLSVRQTRLP